ncbi:uncharacterized protein BDZ99DRAFT_576008 [Mytilinidion resinicola]|uniref:FAR-17a/AIG1-like protein n=1 Tax=Mytilinidion resinicola TaxID=574789 RepID=A0A6A6Y3V4_9PEZI|nr:uncharacterized protein BDZ99DRAFT_576008 [Mytilinidion resinicola]KAF2803516.1 hypothetical protein BDZ99DRAFT_576008 [Mytilinidion resinicola]
MPAKKRTAPSRARPSSELHTPAKPPQPRRRPNFAAIQLRFVALISYAISFEHLYSHPNKINQGFGGHYQFLTNITLVLAAAASVLGALEILNAPRLIQSLKARILFLATPLSLLITATYWPLYLLRPAVLKDTTIAPFAPLKKDIGFHLLPALFVLADVINFTPRRYAPSPLRALGVFGTFLGGYGAWLWLCWSKNGIPPYPVLEKMDVGTMAGLAVAVAGVLGGLSWGVEGLCCVLDQE